MGFLPDRTEVVLRHILERNASKTPDKECLLFEDGERWTYGKALRQVYCSANALAHFNVKRNDNVLIFLPNGQDWIRAWWGVSSLGARIVPVNTAYKGEMLRHICEDSSAKVIVTSPELGDRLKGLDLNLGVIDPSALTQGSSDEPKIGQPIEPWDIYMILYTSGTTGPSKGVIVPYFQSYATSYWGWSCKASSDDTILINLPLFHAAGLNHSCALWIVGGRVALRSGFSASRYFDVIRETGATMATMVGTIPAILEGLPPKPDDADNPLRVVLCAPMVKDPAAFKARFGIEDLHNVYGMSESCRIFATCGPISDPKTCGRVAEGIQVRLVDEHDIPVPTGETGELTFRSDLPWMLNAGYWRRPEETAKAWRNGWFHTGDLFTCDENGNYFFTDRKKDALRRGGENISSFEVEKGVSAYPGVVEAACVSVPGDQVGEDEVKVFVVPRDKSSFDSVDLINFLIPRMPYFMIPRYVELLDELPKTATLRVKKVELRARGNSALTWDRVAAGIRVTKNS